MQSKITIELTRANAGLAAAVAAVLKKPLAAVVSSCLQGSTNPKSQDTKHV